MTLERIPYGRQTIDDDDLEAVVRALGADLLTTGPAVAEFESALGQRVGGVEVVAVNSGTAALHAAYVAAGVGRDGGIVTTPMTFAATATAALQAGGVVRFADVIDGSLCLDPEAAAAAADSKIRAIVAVDYAGQPADLDELADVARSFDAVLVEDAAHALGATYRGVPVGAIADLTTFSFHPVKTITTAEGGAVAVGRTDLARSIREFRNHGLVRDAARQRTPGEGGWHQEIQQLGWNYRIPDVLAALGSSQLNKLSAFLARRGDLVRRYRAALGDLDGLRLLDVASDREPAWHLFPVRILGGRRRDVYERMRVAGIDVQVHYLPVHRHPLFSDLGYRQGMCPVAESAYEELISLPLYPRLADSEQDRVIEVLRGLLA